MTDVRAGSLLDDWIVCDSVSVIYKTMILILNFIDYIHCQHREPPIKLGYGRERCLSEKSGSTTCAQLRRFHK